MNRKKRNRILLITAIVFVVFAIAFLILGFALSGADVLAWFGSKWAMIIYTVYGVYILIILFILAGDWIKKI